MISSAGISPAGEGDRCAYPVGCGHQSGTGADIVYACKYVLCKACATGCRVPLYVRVVDDESGTAEAASANEPDSAVPEAFYDNTLGKRLGGGLLAVGIQGGEGLSA